MGHLIKRIETEYADKIDNKIEDINIKKKVGDPNKLLMSPGSATYEDLMAYMEQQRVERLKVK